MSLRTLTRIVVVALGLVTVITAAALILITGYLRVLAGEIQTNLESVRAAEEINLQLLRHGRTSYLGALAGDAEHLREALEAHRELRRWQEIAKKHVTVGDEEELFRDLDLKLDAYFGQHAGLIAEQAIPIDVYVRSAPALHAAYDAAQALVQVNVRQAAAAQSSVEYWNGVANLAGIGVVLALVLGVAAIGFAVDRQVYRPLVALGNAIHRYTHEGKRIPIEQFGTEELREMIRTFEDLTARLEEHRRTRLRFLAGVAHDLRNPLGAIKLAVTAPPSPDSGGGLLRSRPGLIERQVDLLSRMITDLLDSTRIESGDFTLRLSETDACQLVRDAAEPFGAISLRHELVLRLPEHVVMLRCDPILLQRVVSNLISNAIKYSPAGGRVEIVVETVDGVAEISVADEGLGIADGELDRIFEPFRRGEASREAIPGVGLGLSIVRRIVEAHGGEISVRSAPGQGSRFAVRLSAPRATERPLQAAAV